jgi:hypothetical protein
VIFHWFFGHRAIASSPPLVEPWIGLPAFLDPLSAFKIFPAKENGGKYQLSDSGLLRVISPS